MKSSKGLMDQERIAFKLPFDCWSLIASYCEAENFFRVINAVKGLYDHMTRLKFPVEDTWFTLKSFPEEPKNIVRKLHYNETCNMLGRFNESKFGVSLSASFPDLSSLKISGYGYFEEEKGVSIPKLDFLSSFYLDMRSKPIMFLNQFNIRLEKCPEIRKVSVRSQVGLQVCLFEKAGKINSLELYGASMSNSELNKYFLTLKVLKFEVNQYMNYGNLPFLVSLDELEITYSYLSKDEVIGKSFPSHRVPNIRTLKIQQTGRYFRLGEDFQKKKNLLNLSNLSRLENIELTGPFLSAIDHFCETLVVTSNKAKNLKLVTFDEDRFILKNVNVFSSLRSLNTNLFVENVIDLRKLETITLNYYKNLNLENLPNIKKLHLKSLSNISMFKRIDNTVRTSVQKIHIEINENMKQNSKIELTDYFSLSELTIDSVCKIRKKRSSSQLSDNGNNNNSLFSLHLGPNIPNLHRLKVTGCPESITLSEGILNLYDLQLSFYDYPSNDGNLIRIVPLTFDPRIRLQKIKIRNSGSSKVNVSMSRRKRSQPFAKRFQEDEQEITKIREKKIISEEEEEEEESFFFENLEVLDLEGTEIHELEGRYSGSKEEEMLYLPNLKHLSIRNFYPESPEFVKSIRNMEHLQTLRLLCWNISPQLRDLDNLKTLEVSPNENFHRFGNFRSLKNLKIVSSCGNSSVLESFEDWIHIENLPLLTYCSYLKTKAINCPNLVLETLW